MIVSIIGMDRFPPLRKANVQASAGKLMATIFLDSEDVFWIEYIQKALHIYKERIKN